MYQTVGHDAVHLVAEAMQLPLYRHVITGKPLQTDSSFGILRSGPTGKDSPADESEQDETEDLHLLLRQVKQHHPDVQGVSVGAILSNYQRFRVETICARPELQLQPLAFLWQRDQSELLAEMVQAGVEAVLIKCAGIGLDQRDLGKSLAIMRPKLERLKGLYGAHVCGEGGEYETLTLDCPLFKKRIQL
jgi:diphthine-ammonia ligase